MGCSYWMTLPLFIYIYMCIYMSYNRTHIRNAYIYIYIYIYINTELLGGIRGHQEEIHNPTHRFRRLFLDLFSMGWRGCASAMGATIFPPSCSSPKIMCQSIHINICSRGVFVIINSKVRNCVIVAIECFFSATIDRCSVMTGMYRRSMMIYSSP